jgi:endonuclease/exonuclease/phosphatase family metal-dependent hydrolase
MLQEVSQEFLDSVCTNLSDLRLVLAEPRPDTKGVAVFAAHGLPDGIQVSAASIKRLAGDVADRSSLALTLTWNGQPFRLLSFHCIRPGSGNKLAIHRAEYDALAEWFREVPDEPALAIGDFNATPWSQRLRSMLGTAALPLRQDAFSIRPTWPAGPLLPLGVPIDLCVHNTQVRVSQSQVGPDIGSDHLPLYCAVSLNDEGPHSFRTPLQ